MVVTVSHNLKSSKIFFVIDCFHSSLRNPQFKKALIKNLLLWAIPIYPVYRYFEHCKDPTNPNFWGGKIGELLATPLHPERKPIEPVPKDPLDAHGLKDSPLMQPAYTPPKETLFVLPPIPTPREA